MSQLPKDLKKLWAEAQRQHQTVNPSGSRIVPRG